MNYPMTEVLALFDEVMRDHVAGARYDAARRERLFWEFLAICLDRPASVRVFFDRRRGPNEAEFLASIVRRLRDDAGPTRLAAALESAGIAGPPRGGDRP